MPTLSAKLLKSILGTTAARLGLYKRTFASKLVIVAFHRVNDQLPPDDLTCTSTAFREFCEFFRDHFRVVPLSQQIDALHAGRAMDGTMSITFDDGYLDNFEVAAPILRELQLPATFFVSTGFIGSNHVPFWDKDLPFQPGWMNWDQVRQLAADGFDIGAHTHTHLNMGVEPTEKVAAELALCRQTLERELGRQTDLFVYPFGGRQNIRDETLALVQKAGFRCSASCYGGINSSGSDPYRLNRIPISIWFKTPDQFGFEVMAGRA